MSDIIPTGWSIAGIGDFNGDGISDILLRCDATGETTDWLGQTGGSFTDNLGNADLTPDPSWHVVGTGDFNGGGRADVVWQNNDGRVTDWLGQLNGGFVGNNLSINPGTSWHVVGTGDFNGDGRSDVLWQNDDGRLTDWLAQPDGSFVGNQLSLNPGNNWHVIGTGDFNGDGRADILWQYDSGQLNDWLGQPDGSFVNNGANMGQVLDLSWHAVGVGDFNGDHRADILWRCTDGTITDWLGTSSGSFVDNSAIGLQSLSNDLQVSGVGDFNGDGKSDVLWRNPDGTLETWVGSANGGILSPMEKLWQDAVTGASRFVNTVVNSLPPASPTDSGGDGRGISLTGFAAIFGPSFPTNYVEGLYDEVHAFTLNTFDPSEGSGFDFTWSASSNVGGGAQQFGSITQFDSGNAYLFDVNGADLIGNWFAGAPPVSEPIPPDAIVITASSAIVITASHETTTGFFLFDPNANGFNFNDGYGGRSGGAGTHYLTPSLDWSIHNAAVQSALQLAGADEAGVIRAIGAWATIVAAALNAHIDPALLAAIAVRETDFRNIDQPNGLGRGWFQIDLGAHPDVTWSQAHDLTFAANYAANILATNMATLARDFPNFTHDQLLQATAASYNFHTSNISGNPATIDVGTAGNNYGSNVLNLMKAFVNPATGRTPGG